MDFLVSEAVDFALTNGLSIKSKATKKITHAPFSLFPTAFPRIHYQNSLEIQPLLNQLFYKLSLDNEFIASAMESLIEVDDFQKNLYKIHCEVLKSKKSKNRISLLICRSDYMLHYVNDTTTLLQQVEFNTISCGLVSLAPIVTRLHKYIINKAGDACNLSSSNLPNNKSNNVVPYGISLAHERFGCPNAVVLMVVQEPEWNMFDQRWIEYGLFETYGITLVRKTFIDVSKTGSIDHDGNLVVDGKIVSVVYFRAGYSPNDFPTAEHWESRKMIELSTAIKCPTISQHIVGAKKFQQLLVNPGRVEKYLTEREAELVRSTFTGLYPLNDDTIKMVLKNPSSYVLKPQREGGGNNSYGSDIPTLLATLKSPQQRASYIFMDLIKPKPVKNTMIVNNEKAVAVDSTCELGVMGLWVSEDDKIIFNDEFGYLGRSKSTAVNEGGVSVGLGCVDSVYLLD